jgi:hypothetical protein
VQAILGLLVILVLPGYALVELLMGRRTLGTIQHLFMTLSSSLALAILGGLTLHQFPLGVRMEGWIAVFAGPILGGGLLAWFLRHRRQHGVVITQRVPIRISQLLLMGTAVVLASGALLLARTPAASDNYAGYTMLWLTPVPGAAATQLQLGLDSKEFAPIQYKLELLVDEQIVHEWALIELAPNQQWQANLTLKAEQRTGTIEANLYRLDRPTAPYRHVVLRPQLAMTSPSIDQ